MSDLTLIKINAPSVLNIFQTEPIKDFKHELKMPMHRFLSGWRIRIWKAQNDAGRILTIIVITDINQGMSVTNAAEYILTDIKLKYYYENDPNTLLFFEHYEEYGSFDRIIGTWENNKCVNVEWQYFAKFTTKDRGTF